MYFPFSKKVSRGKFVGNLYTSSTTANLNGIFRVRLLYFLILFISSLHSCIDSTLCLSHRGRSALSCELWDTPSVCHLPLHFCPVLPQFSSSLAFSCISSPFSYFPTAFQNALPAFLWAFHHMHACSRADTHTHTHTHASFHLVIHPVSVCVWGVW